VIVILAPRDVRSQTVVDVAIVDASLEDNAWRDAAEQTACRFHVNN